MRTFKKVLSVALVLAMAVSCFALTSLAKSTPGTITVDGKLDDNGWAEMCIRDSRNASYLSVRRTAGFVQIYIRL